MTDLDLDAIQARADAATGGPWKSLPEFIAHARTDIPALIAEVKALRGKVAAVVAMHHVHDHHGDYAFCAECSDEYPCATIRTLRPSAPTTGEPNEP